jgi:hypothetical protein
VSNLHSPESGLAGILQSKTLDKKKLEEEIRNLIFKNR